MNSRIKTAGVILCLMAMTFFAAMPFWRWFYARAASAAAQARIRTLVESNPQLKTALDVAMQDDLITYPEAKVIVEAAGEKLDPE